MRTDGLSPLFSALAGLIFAKGCRRRLGGGGSRRQGRLHAGGSKRDTCTTLGRCGREQHGGVYPIAELPRVRNELLQLSKEKRRIGSRRRRSRDLRRLSDDLSEIIEEMEFLSGRPTTASRLRASSTVSEICFLFEQRIFRNSGSGDVMKN